jgi:hypothetical protein
VGESKSVAEAVAESPSLSSIQVIAGLREELAERDRVIARLEEALKDAEKRLHLLDLGGDATERRKLKLVNDLSYLHMFLCYAIGSYAAGPEHLEDAITRMNQLINLARSYRDDLKKERPARTPHPSDVELVRARMIDAELEPGTEPDPPQREFECPHGMRPADCSRCTPTWQGGE